MRVRNAHAMSTMDAQKGYSRRLELQRCDLPTRFNRHLLQAGERAT
jgi:hypothetical protein